MDYVLRDCPFARAGASSSTLLLLAAAPPTTPFMATPNYSFEKRKRDLAKKAAKEAKRLKKKEKSGEPHEPVIIAQNEQGSFADDDVPAAEDGVVSE
jgi:hypothetical protein